MTESRSGDELPTRRLEATLELGRTLAARLDTDEQLSRILPGLKDLLERVGDEKHEQLMRFEMYGLKPPTIEPSSDGDRSRREALDLFFQLHAMADNKALAKSISMGDVETGTRLSLQKGMLTVNSIGQIERNLASWPEAEKRLRGASLVDGWLENAVVANEQQEVLHRVRMYVAEKARAALLSVEVEVENHRLVGVDYKIVIESLSALDSPVGGELRVALNALRSDNPADWSLAALACRNVVIALGRTLWDIEADTYESALAGRTLTMKGNVEKNRLCAFIDQHYRANEESEVGSRLASMDELVRHVYDVGSKGKARTTHAEAQGLVVDTFRLVAELLEVTALEPLKSFLVTSRSV